jgi:hypothetical protein
MTLTVFVGARHGKAKLAVGDKGRQVLENIDENNRVIRMFLEFRKELDDKHDRYEKIVKTSRDITIENKRIIFLLHSTNTDMQGLSFFLSFLLIADVILVKVRRKECLRKLIQD